MYSLKKHMKKQILGSWSEQPNKRKKELFNSVRTGFSATTLIINSNVFFSRFSINVCLNQDNSRVFTVESAHKTTEQTSNTWTQLACHTCVTFAKAVIMTNQAEEKLLKIPIYWFRAAWYRNVCHSNYGEPLERATPTESFKKEKYHYVLALICHVTRLSWARACSATCPFQIELSV